MRKDDVIVFDEEYVYAAKELNNYCLALVKMIDSYSKCVNVIMDIAIHDKEITTKLNEIVLEVKPMKSTITKIGKRLEDNCRKFIREVDEADKFLY